MTAIPRDGDGDSESALAELQPFVTKSDRVYRALREAVLVGDLEPGTKINLAQVARELGTSETPVREALKRLESDRLVRAEPHTGFLVTEYSLQELIENLVLRREIETIATQLAAADMTPDDVAHLREFVEQMDVAAAEDDWVLYARLNKEFHRALITRCPLAEVRRTALALWEVGERTRALLVQRPRRKNSQEEHHQMIRAIERGDFEVLGDLVRQQKTAGISVAMELLDAPARDRLSDLLAVLEAEQTESAGTH